MIEERNVLEDTIFAWLCGPAPALSNVERANFAVFLGGRMDDAGCGHLGIWLSLVSHPPEAECR